MPAAFETPKALPFFPGPPPSQPSPFQFPKRQTIPMTIWATTSSKFLKLWKPLIKKRAPSQPVDLVGFYRKAAHPKVMNWSSLAPSLAHLLMQKKYANSQARK